MQYIHPGTAEQSEGRVRSTTAPSAIAVPTDKTPPGPTQVRTE